MQTMEKQPTAPVPIATPCVKVCAVDGQSGLCFGCGRSLQEIGGWVRMSVSEREAVMAELPERLDVLNARLSAISKDPS